jgi:parvulin-like peptidyl-prolyl isomerase
MMRNFYFLSTWRTIVPMLVGGCLFLTACGSTKSSTTSTAASADALTSNVAIVGSDVITKADLTGLMKAIDASETARKATVPTKGTTAYRALQDQAVAYLVEAAIYEQRASQLGIGVTSKDVSAAIAKIKKQTFGGSEAKFRVELKATGESPHVFADLQRLTLTEERIESRVFATIKIATSAEKTYYQKHQKAYRTSGTQVVKPFSSVKSSIASSLLAQKKKSVMAAWLKTTIGSFCGREVTYNPDYQPLTAGVDPCGTAAAKPTTSTP